MRAAEEVLGKETRAARKPWTGEETLELMDEKGKHKNAKDEQRKMQLMLRDLGTKYRENAKRRETIGYRKNVKKHKRCSG